MGILSRRMAFQKPTAVPTQPATAMSQPPERTGIQFYPKRGYTEQAYEASPNKIEMFDGTADSIMKEGSVGKFQMERDQALRGIMKMRQPLLGDKYKPKIERET
jgi:hypothetical protein